MASARNGHLREERFRRIMARRGVVLERPIKPFRFGVSTYRPDFYSPKEGVFYEVLGTRQRVDQILPRLDLMALRYPRVVLRLVTPTAEPVIIKCQTRLERMLALPRGTELVAAMSTRKMQMKDLANEIGVTRTYLSGCIYGRFKSNKVKDGIERFLRRTA